LSGEKAIVTINVCNVKTSQELHSLLKESLEFPDFYGENWDAFWDAITGLVELPMVLQFISWSNLKEKLPADANALLECLNDFNEEYPNEKRELLFN